MSRNLRLKTIAVISLLVCLIPIPVQAEDYSDTAYWTAKCTGDEAGKDKEACKGFLDHMTAQSKDLEKSIGTIDGQKKEIAANIEKYAAKIKDYQKQIDDLNAKIQDLQKKIDMKQEEIDDKEAEADALREKVGRQMVSTQPTMRLSVYADVLMGAKTLTDFVRILNGLQDITKYSESNMEKLQDVLASLEKAKADLKQDQAAFKASQDDVLAKKYEAQVIEEEYERQETELTAQRAQLVANADDIRKKMKDINDALGRVTASEGWAYPVPGVQMTWGAGTWNYASGGRHYGEDFGAGVKYGESYAVAAANGVVLNANDAGCGYGHIGDYCPVVGGGNEIMLLVIVNGRTYGVKYYHLMAGTFEVKTGDIVEAGDKLAKVGSSGNSSGPHCHICVYDLGGADQFQHIASTWNGDMAMNTGWNQSTERICEFGASVPCKIRPESVFGTGR